MQGRARRPSRYAAFAIARSWIARPVESKSVMSLALRRPSASPTSTAPISVTSSRRTTPAATAAASSPPWLACSQSSQKRCARAKLLDRDLGLSRPVRAHERDVLARGERALRVEDLRARRHRDDDLARESLGRARRDSCAEPLRDEPTPRLVDVPHERRRRRARRASAPSRRRSRRSRRRRTTTPRRGTGCPPRERRLRPCAAPSPRRRRERRAGVRPRRPRGGRAPSPSAGRARGSRGTT